MSAMASVLTPSQDDLDSIVGDLVYTLDELPATTPPAPTGVTRSVRGRVAIHGEQACVVEVQLSLDAAVLVAQSMFGLEPGEASESDVRDAVGELSNIVAGNTKSLADADLVLGLPHTDVIGAPSPPSPSTVAVTHPWRGHDLHVTVNPPTTGEQP